MAVLDILFAFLILIIFCLIAVVAWAIFSTAPRKPKLEASVRRSRRNLNVIIDEQDGALYTVKKRRFLGEFCYLLTLQGARGITIKKKVWEWQLIPMNTLVAVAGNNVAVWKLAYDSKSDYQALKKKYQETFNEKQKIAGALATLEAEEREHAGEIIDEVAKVVGKAGKEKEANR